MASLPGTPDQAERQRAMALHKSGAFAEAIAIYRQLLETGPDDFDLNHWLGMALLQSGQAAAALGSLQTATRLNAQSAAACCNLGIACDTLGRTDEAITAFDRAIALKPDFVEPYMRKAMALHRAQRLAEAIAAYDDALAKNNDAGLWNNKGVALREQGDATAALTAFDQAVKLQPTYADAWVNKGNARRDLQQWPPALADFDRALALQPQHAGALIAKSWALEESGDMAGALQIIDALLMRQAADGTLHLRRAEILRRLRQYDDALKSYTLAVQYRPQDPEVYLRWALFLAELERFDGAIAAYDMALSLDDRNADAHFGRAEALRQMNRLDEADDGYARAAALAPDRVFRSAEPQSAGGYYQRAEARRSLNRLQEALEDYDRAFDLDPDYPGLQGARLHLQMHLCDWRDYPTVHAMLDKLRAGLPVVQPFPLVGLPATAEDQLLAARLYTDKKYPLLPPVWTGEKYAHDKIRVAYLSADFHQHATAYLMAGLFEAHDRQGFEWTALSCGKDDQSPMRQRLTQAFDHFIDVRGMSDEAVARLIRAAEIDILVDLKGYTQNSRFGILTRRSAPLQVTYIGYPGTTASAAIDYAIADKRVVPDTVRPFFSEKMIYLPHSYQVNDSTRAIAPVPPSRETLGLPPEGIVFCSFNQSYKITPDIYDVWMRILDRVPGSVLWLLRMQDQAADNLRREAEKRGIAAARLVFAGHATLPDHLARLSQADLFLDNLPCNAHTTASDALWAGVPVLTCAGETFAGRVAASLLSAVDLPELITLSLAEYEEKAVALATDDVALRALRQKLAGHRETQPLFDTARSARHIEAGYREIHRRFHAGEIPDDVFIDAAI